mgnify:FL=1
MLSDARRRLAALTFALSISVLVILAVAVRGGPTVLDVTDPRLVALRVGPVDALLDAADLAGSLPLWAGAVALLTVALARTKLRLGGEAFVVAVGAEIAATAIKAVVGRARPPGAELSDLLVAAGFPSGHVTRTAVLIGLVIALAPWAQRRPRLAIALGLVAVALVGLARVSSAAHFTSDVLGACLLAAAILAGWRWISSSADARAPAPTLSPAAGT